MTIATRRAWRRAWNLIGPVLPLALAAGLIVGSFAAAVMR